MFIQCLWQRVQYQKAYMKLVSSFYGRETLYQKVHIAQLYMFRGQRTPTKKLYKTLTYYCFCCRRKLLKKLYIAQTYNSQAERYFRICK